MSLAKLTPRMECLADLGPVTEPSMSQQICRVFPGGCSSQKGSSHTGELHPQCCSGCTACLAYLSQEKGTT